MSDGPGTAPTALYLTGTLDAAQVHYSAAPMKRLR
jgi:hypothetical protein